VKKEPEWYQTAAFYACYFMGIVAALFAMAFVIAVCISFFKGA